jgi:hypothetical protein
MTDGVNNFLEGALRTDTQDFLGKMEGFTIQGVKGMNVACKFIDIFLLTFFIGSAKNHKQCVSAARANVHDLMGEGLIADTPGREHHWQQLCSYGMEILLVKCSPAI